MARDVSPERPLQVVVLGNSKTVLSIPERTGADDGLYAEVVRDRLAAAGVPVRVVLEGRWFSFAKVGFRRYEEAVRAHLPDVLVVHYGFNEAQPWLVPVPVVRHFMTQHTTTTKPGRLYRAKVAPHLWRQVRHYRRAVAPLAGMRTWQTTPYRFSQIMSQLIKAARYDLKPLVLVMDIDPPNDFVESFLPGFRERHAVMQQVLQDVVDGFADPEVRFVRGTVALEESGELTTVDGMHWTPAGHRVIGELVADEVLRWLQRR